MEQLFFTKRRMIARLEQVRAQPACFLTLSAFNIREPDAGHLAAKRKKCPSLIFDGLKQESRIEKCAHVCQILWCIDTAAGRLLRDVYGNRVAMPERPQLFERFGDLQGSLGQPRK